MSIKDNTVRITLSNNTERESVDVAKSETPKAILQKYDMYDPAANITLDGIKLSGSDMDVPVSELGVTSGSTLMSIIKTANA